MTKEEEKNSELIEQEAQNLLTNELALRAEKKTELHELMTPGACLFSVAVIAAGIFVMSKAVHFFKIDLGLLGLVLGMVGILLFAGGISTGILNQGKYRKEKKQHERYMEIFQQNIEHSMQILQKECQSMNDKDRMFFCIPDVQPELYDNLYHGVKGEFGTWGYTRTISSGDLCFHLVDKEGIVVHDMEQAKKQEDNLRLYWMGKREKQSATAEEIWRMIESQDYIVLYRDEAFLREHPKKKYFLTYLMDESTLAELSEEGKGSYKPKKLDVRSALLKYKIHFGEKMDVLLNWSDNITVAKEYRAYLNNVQCKDQFVVSSYKMKIRKKALLIWSSDRLVCILLLNKDVYSVCHLHFWLDQPAAGDGMNIDQKIDDIVWSNKYGQCIDEIELSETNREITIASAMDYIGSEFSKYMKVPDVLERRPDGISEQNWRYWIMVRFVNGVQCMEK